MKLLVLGGTRFLGLHVAGQALQRGHAVTLVHRGRSGPGLFPEATHVVADRNHGLDALSNGSWDAVIDTSAYVPRHVRDVAARLSGRVGCYQLVSTISVYRDIPSGGVDERGETVVLDDPATEVVDGATYGGLKRLCEEAAEAAFGATTCTVRPGLIVGPHDPTGRWTWWLERMARGGTALAPGDPGSPVQFIDARDLAAWMLALAERQAGGLYNATGPDAPLTMGAMIDAMRAALAPPGTMLRWADEAWLLAQGVQPWMELPLWLPQASIGLHRTDCRAARAAGLRCRPLDETIRDTAAWAATTAAVIDPPGGPPRQAPGLAHQREQELLALLR